jgi:hypothetical protein
VAKQPESDLTTIQELAVIRLMVVKVVFCLQQILRLVRSSIEGHPGSRMRELYPTWLNPGSYQPRLDRLNDFRAWCKGISDLLGRNL